MQIAKNKTTAIAIAMLLTLSMAASTLLPRTLAQVPVPAGTKVPTYAHLNVAPNPAGVGQTVTLNMFLLCPLLTSEDAVNFTIVETTPSGTTTTLGPFHSDATGGTYTTFIPDKTGNYTFQFFYGGQTLTGIATGSSRAYTQYTGVIELPSYSDVVTLVVQQEPIPRSAYPITPLPTQWWQTPVTAENVQNWYAITGPWLGYGSVAFASTGGYNTTGNYNPQTESVLSGHVLWTKVWASGGVSGLSGNEESGHYWSTSQYWPKYAPVIINGIMYSTWYTATTGYSNGIMATDLYTGQTLWTINTTNPLRCGMVTQWKTINAYGCIGPYIWTTGTLPAADTGGTQIANSGTQFNMYDALTGKYVLSVVNGTNPSFTTDENGNMIGYYINSTVGTMTTYGNPPLYTGVPQPITGHVDITRGSPVLCCFNMSQAISYNPTGRSLSWGWSPSENTVIDFGRGVMWAVPVYNNISGVPIGPALYINGITNGAVVMTAGFTFAQGFGGEQNGWLVVGAQDASDGHQLWCKNLTYTDTDILAPFTRVQMQIQDGLWILGNMGYNWHMQAYDARTGAPLWKQTLTGFNGAAPNVYDQFNIRTYNGPGVVFFVGLGGDIWCINDTTGKQLWYTNTTALIGSPGIETPYNIWPLWVFPCDCMSNDVAYFAVGHEYDPPLFHGAQLLAINMTNGKLIWSELDMSIESTSISYGILLSRNAYDNQIYAFGKGPSTTTVTAPNVGVTTATPITITGTVMDISPGSKQQAIALNFPNGIPCVSDESQSKWMEYVYQQQPLPANTTGVSVTLSVIDSNNNYRDIGTATSDSSGMFSYIWTPDIPGKYTVIATFAGSNSYYGSCAEAVFYASTAPTPAPTVTPQANLATTGDLLMYIVAAAIAIIIAIAIATVLLLRKRP